MDQSEEEDFNALLKRSGYSSNDFQITETDLTEYDPNRDVPLDMTVTVKRISTNIQKTYYSGHISNWVVDFEKDLSSGAFK